MLGTLCTITDAMDATAVMVLKSPIETVATLIAMMKTS